MISHQPRITHASDVIQISVEFISHPRQRLVQWLKNNIYLEESRDVMYLVKQVNKSGNRFNQKATLIITNSTAHDLGIYTLKITNALGMAEVDIHVMDTRNGEELRMLGLLVPISEIGKIFGTSLIFTLPIDSYFSCDTLKI